MQAFVLKGDPSWNSSAGLEGINRFGVGGARCPRCGPWTTCGSIYPVIDEAQVARILRGRVRGPAPWDEFREVAARLEAVLGPGRPIWPGTDLGPFEGKAYGELGDFAWVNPWTPIVRQSVWETMVAEEIHIPAVPLELEYVTGPVVPLVELEALPKVRLFEDPVSPGCSICGRVGGTAPDPIRLDAATYDAEIPLQRIANVKTYMIVNERLAEFIQRHRLRDVTLKPVELVG